MFDLVLPLTTRNDCGVSRWEVRVAIGLFWVFMASGMSAPAQARSFHAASEITVVSGLSSQPVKGRAAKTRDYVVFRWSLMNRYSGKLNNQEYQFITPNEETKTGRIKFCRVSLGDGELEEMLN